MCKNEINEEIYCIYISETQYCLYINSTLNRPIDSVHRRLFFFKKLTIDSKIHEENHLEYSKQL